MKKDKSTGMDDKYWKGISSLQEERALKGQVDKPYFKGLDQLSEEDMNWDFEVFMEAAKHVDNTSGKRIGKGIKLRFWLYGAAAAAILVGGFVFFKSDENRITTYENKRLSAVARSPDIVDSVDDKANGNQEEHVHRLVTPQKKVYNNVASTTRPETTKPEVVGSEEESYVIVNGKPVYDEAEAQEIVLASLKIMAIHFQEGKNALEKVKYINIEL